MWRVGILFAVAAAAGCIAGWSALELLEHGDDDWIPTFPSSRLSLVVAISALSSCSPSPPPPADIAQTKIKPKAFDARSSRGFTTTHLRSMRRRRGLVLSGCGAGHVRESHGGVELSGLNAMAASSLGASWAR
uniref:Uncharacterized protein n=2 Tax=Oryza TaxID=4527 RepID=A0A0E0F2X4_9ORYZ